MTAPDPTAATDPVLFRELPTACGRCFGVATLNAPASLNALSLAMVELLLPRLQTWAADPGVAGVLLDASGDKAFCAGGDLRGLYPTLRTHGTAPNPHAQRFFALEYRLDHCIHTFPKPLLCWGHGIVMGGGMGLMVGASHRVVTETSRLAMPEISIGLYPDVGGSWFLSRMTGRSGLFLALTGAPLNPTDALVAGLADFCVPQAAKTALLQALAATRWSGDDTDHARLSHLIEAHAGALSLPESNLQRCEQAIRDLMGHDGLADIAARLQALDSSDAWLAAAAQTFRDGSPTSATLGHALWQRARHRSLADVFRMEFDVSLGCCAHHDFAEGIRALLIDKDRKPRWQPATLADVDAALIEDHFVPRYGGAHPLADLT